MEQINGMGHLSKKKKAVRRHIIRNHRVEARSFLFETMESDSTSCLSVHFKCFRCKQMVCNDYLTHHFINIEIQKQTFFSTGYITHILNQCLEMNRQLIDTKHHYARAYG